MPADKISIVFSFRNEEETLPALLERLSAMSKDRPEEFEFIFVNDRSCDRSLEILGVAHAADPRVKVITMARRSGPSECVFAGLAACVGDAAIFMDCDLQDPPELIPTLIEKWKGGAEVVHTMRTQRMGEHWLRLWMTRRAYEVINWTSNGSLPIEAGDFKLVSRRVVDHLLSLTEHDPYLRGLAVWIGFNQTFVPYERHPRHDGDSKFSGLHRNAVKTMISGVTSFSFTPIYVVGLAGCAGLAMAPLLLLGGAFAAAAILALWGGLMAALGLVGLYVARVYKEVRGRPRWIIADCLGIEGKPDPAITSWRSGR